MSGLPLLPELPRGFVVDEATARAEIGEEHVKMLGLLAQRLYGEAAHLSYRIAPSIIVRGEAELFGLNMPRFACRVYLREGCDSFVNARRIHTLSAAIERALRTRGGGNGDPFEKELKSLLDRLRDQSRCLRGMHSHLLELGKERKDRNTLKGGNTSAASPQPEWGLR